MKGSINSILKENTNSSTISQGRNGLQRAEPWQLEIGGGESWCMSRKKGQKQLKIQVQLLCVAYKVLHGLVPATLSSLSPPSILCSSFTTVIFKTLETIQLFLCSDFRAILPPSLRVSASFTSSERPLLQLGTNLQKLPQHICFPGKQTLVY